MLRRSLKNMFAQAKNGGQECRNARRKHQQQKGDSKGGRGRGKSDYFRKFMKVRLHNSFPYCDALYSRDGLTWNLRPLLLFTKETASRPVIPVRFLWICLIYYVSRKYKIDSSDRKSFARVPHNFINIFPLLPSIFPLNDFAKTARTFCWIQFAHLVIDCL